MTTAREPVARWWCDGVVELVTRRPELADIGVAPFALQLVDLGPRLRTPRKPRRAVAS